MAKATIIRLAGTPSLPAVAPFFREFLALYIHGVSDFCDLRQAPRAPVPHLVPISLPLLLIFFTALHNPFLPLIVFLCPLLIVTLSYSPLLIYDELSRPSFVPVVMKEIQSTSPIYRRRPYPVGK